MKWTDVKGLIGKFAPMVAGALGTPLMGGAVKVLCGALGLNEEAKPEDVKALFEAGQLTGEQLIALKKQDAEYALQMRALGINSVKDLEALAVQDRISARDREIKTSDITPRILAGAITIGFFGILGYMLKYDVAPANRDILNVMLGSLGTAWVAVVTYYFGSSSSSSEKTEMIFRSTQTEKD
jgi:hypothetical protein